MPIVVAVNTDLRYAGAASDRCGISISISIEIPVAAGYRRPRRSANDRGGRLAQERRKKITYSDGPRVPIAIGAMFHEHASWWPV